MGISSLGLIPTERSEDGAAWRHLDGGDARGLSNDEIATHLVVSKATVKTHVNRVITKLDSRTRPQLVVLAYESGWLRPGETKPA